MTKLFKRGFGFVLLALVAILVITACGGDEAPTATPTQPPPTAAPTQAPTAVPTATPTRAPTATPVPTATPNPQVPKRLDGKRGGTLNLRVLNLPRSWDTYDTVGQVDLHNLGPMLNNLVWPDPYGDGFSLTGDLAQSWQVSSAGDTVTFRLRQGVKFHDGSALTSKDVAYNLTRAWKPRAPTMTYYQARVAAVQAIDTPDDLTIVVKLNAPSNAFLQGIGMAGVLIYPAAIPFPEQLETWKKSPIGTGPYKYKGSTATTMEFVRNDAYHVSGLPYADAIQFAVIADTTLSVAAFRAGRLDASNFDTSAIEISYQDLQREQRFVTKKVNIGLYFLHPAQKAPWSYPSVRQAISLAINRQEIIDGWLKGLGDRAASPLMPPELGGQWGLASRDILARPGFSEDKTADRARARQLLTQAGVVPGDITVSILAAQGGDGLYGEIVERSFAAMGFKTKLDLVDRANLVPKLLRGEFDFAARAQAISFDDPSDYPSLWVLTGGGQNYGKWSNPRLDALYTEQDRTLDTSRRRQLLAEFQEIILQDNFIIPEFYRFGYMGHMPWVKNYPSLPFLFSPWYRWEQVYVER